LQEGFVKLEMLRTFWDRLSTYLFEPAMKKFEPVTQKKKKKKVKKLFSPYKIIDSENFIKVSQNPNKVARDTQGLPTVPHNDFGGLNFKGLVSKYLLLTIFWWPPHHTKSLFLKKNRTRGTLTSEKTSDSALSGGCGVDIWSSFLFCVSSFGATVLQVNEPVCPIASDRQNQQKPHSLLESTQGALFCFAPRRLAYELSSK